MKNYMNDDSYVEHLAKCLQLLSSMSEEGKCVLFLVDEDLIKVYGDHLNIDLVK